MDDGGKLDVIGAQPTEVADASPEASSKPPKQKRTAAKAPKVATGNISGGKGAAKAKSGKPAPPPWTFPKNTLEDAIKIARAIEEQNAGNPMKPDMLARAVGY